MSHDATSNEALETLNSVLPCRLLTADKGHGSFLTFDMVPNSDSQSDFILARRTHQLHFWVYLCRWVLRRDGEILLLSEEMDDEKFVEVLSPMAGESLIEFRVDAAKHEIKCLFSDGSELLLSADLPFYGAKAELFMLFFRGTGYLVEYSQERGLRIAHGSEVNNRGSQS